MTATTVVAPDPVASPDASESAAPRYGGLVTRLIAFVIDAALIDLVALLVGVAAALIGALFRVPDHRSLWIVLGGAAYILWSVGYFVVFWSTTGQTPGARVMQIQVQTGNGGTIKPRRAVVRAVGVLLAALPLFLGFASVLFDYRRRAFQDWLAGTVVVVAPAVSVAERLRTRRRADYLASNKGPPVELER